LDTAWSKEKGKDSTIRISLRELSLEDSGYKLHDLREQFGRIVAC